MDLRTLAAIFVGGAAGALARVGLDVLFPAANGTWPWTTFAINVSGSFVLGYVATRFQGRPPDLSYRRPLLGTGLCGTYTTFSTMQVEILAMLDHGRAGLAAAYALSSILAGLTAVVLGTGVVRRRSVQR
jgi:CrcB protein